ncbi:MAG: hypothetical protein SVG88_03610 [Halobacteriales archaeon]|nr:hypothetical protein [Halobacteriales archaeon]
MTEYQPGTNGPGNDAECEQRLPQSEHNEHGDERQREIDGK